MQRLYFKGLSPRELSEYTAASILIEKTHPQGLGACSMVGSSEFIALLPDDVDFQDYLTAARDPELTGRMLAAAYQEQYKQLTYWEA